jgi:hypothetical protein
LASHHVALDWLETSGDITPHRLDRLTSLLKACGRDRAGLFGGLLDQVPHEVHLVPY